MSAGSWEEWSRHVLKEIESLRADVNHGNEKTTECLVEITRLKTSATFVGALAGFGASLVPLVIGFVIDHYLK
jgi:hypothetical protein